MGRKLSKQQKGRSSQAVDCEGKQCGKPTEGVSVWCLNTGWGSVFSNLPLERHYRLPVFQFNHMHDHFLFLQCKGVGLYQCQLSLQVTQAVVCVSLDIVAILCPFSLLPSPSSHSSSPSFSCLFSPSSPSSFQFPIYNSPTSALLPSTGVTSVCQHTQPLPCP